MGMENDVDGLLGVKMAVMMWRGWSGSVEKAARRGVFIHDFLL